MSRIHPIAAISALLLVSSCGGSREEHEPALGVALSAIELENALSPNALSPNALSPNALSPNALSPNALSPNGLSGGALAAIQDPGEAGALSRAFLRYAVSCALDAEQSFAFSWTDALNITHQESYPGLLGLATYWGEGALDTAGQEWVSACLAARTNWYGASVVISSRAPHPALDELEPGELDTYVSEEGAFWGNVFTASPALHACRVLAHVPHSRARLRDCAAGHLDGWNVEECGIIEIVGRCSDHCQGLGGGLFHPTCTANGTSTTRAITVFLD